MIIKGIKPKEKISEGKKENIISLIVLVIGFLIHFYWVLPTYMLYINSKTSVAEIEKIDKALLKFNYFNEFTNSNYYLAREINESQYSKLKGKSALNVLYPEIYPEAVIIKELEKKPILLWPLIFHTFLLTGIIKIGKSLF